MKPITKYEAIDGKLFDTEKECLEYEAFVDHALSVHKILPGAIDSGCSFANGGGFIQHSVESVQRFEKGLAELIELDLGEENRLRFESNPNGIIGRIIDDGDNRYLKKFMYRFACIDNLGREWGQPYYRIHPERGTDSKWENVGPVPLLKRS